MTRKRRRRRFRKTNEMLFYNSTFKSMTFDEVKMNMLNFMRKDPNAYYEIRIGTDSQVRIDTLFVTGIVVRRVGADGIGKGAWACLKDYYVPRRVESLREKIGTETTLSQEVAFLLDEDFHSDVVDILLPNVDNGAGYDVKIHIDVGEHGPTRDLISEMVGRVKAMGIEAQIKPDSYVASGYANRYTK